MYLGNDTVEREMLRFIDLLLSYLDFTNVSDPAKTGLYASYTSAFSAIRFSNSSSLSS